jgi:hypothetical protein
MRQPISQRFQAQVGDLATKPRVGDPSLMSDNFSALKDTPGYKQSNVVDLYITSGSSYGHRAFAFLNQTDGKRYVLDPYSGDKV